ncbi:sulfide dehydrogenase cytochrome subunit [Nitrobacteraceae bacterium AZCC 1564]
MKALRFAFLIAPTIACLGTAAAASLPPPGAASCSGCHGVHEPASSAIPRIYGRDANEIVSVMTAFRDGSRPSTVMSRIAKGFSDDELRPIAAWLASQK